MSADPGVSRAVTVRPVSGRAFSAAATASDRSGPVFSPAVSGALDRPQVADAAAPMRLAARKPRRVIGVAVMPGVLTVGLREVAGNLEGAPLTPGFRCWLCEDSLNGQGSGRRGGCAGHATWARRCLRFSPEPGCSAMGCWAGCPSTSAVGKCSSGCTGRVGDDPADHGLGRRQRQPYRFAGHMSHGRITTVSQFG